MGLGRAFWCLLLLLQYISFEGDGLGSGQCKRIYGGDMRRLTIGIGFALALLSTMPAEAYERPFAWTGLYVGVNGGYSWGRATAEVEVSTVGGSVVSESRSGDVSGWLGGGQIGYNWRSQRWVYGVEADFQWTGQDGDVSACSGPACATASYDLDWFGTLRGRVGYLLEPRALLYLTGGLAYGHLSADFSASAPPLGPVSISDSATRAGGSSAAVWNGR